MESDVRDEDEGFMRRAIRLADSPSTCILPNPRVGAVIVCDDRIVGEGFHKGPGHPHAEVEAIRNADANGFRSYENATLYVSLEPCSHTKKRTPPCAPLVVSKKFQRVVVAHEDPNPLVSGRGIQHLKRAGTFVTVGCLANEAEALNQAFVKNQKFQRPYISLKLAMTFDGKMADDEGRSKWITSDLMRRYVHELRARADAVGVGVGTIDADDPKLNSRIGTRKHSKRIVIFGKPQKKIEKLKTTRENGIQNIVLCSQKKSLKSHLKNLFVKERISHLFVEGGPRLASSFLSQNLADEIILTYGRGFLGGRGTFSLLNDKKRKLTSTLSFVPQQVRLIGPDVLIRGLKNVYRTH